MSDTNVKPLSTPYGNHNKRIKYSDEYMAKMKTFIDGVTGVVVAPDRPKFRATTGKQENGVYNYDYFPFTESGFEAAVKASKDFRERQDKKRKRKANRTPNERRDENLETYGGSSALERDFLTSLKSVFEGSNIDYLILNDGTNADNAFKFVNDLCGYQFKQRQQIRMPRKFYAVR